MATRANYISTLLLLVVCCSVLAVSGCASRVASQATLRPVPALPVAKLGLFSTYASDSARILCEAPGANCREDALSPMAFLQAFQRGENSQKIIVPPESADYELLIANLGRDEPATQWRSFFSDESDTVSQFAEFTLTWRGIELSSSLVSDTFLRSTSDAQMAQSLIATWWQRIGDQAIFSAGFIYRQLHASDYDNELALPASIDSFSQAVTELYPDPLEGVISRYTHPDFEDALVDINVYPIRQSLSLATADILDEELQSELSQAQSVATSRDLQLSMIHTAQDTESMTPRGPGRRLALAASSPTQDTIYASIYAFRLEDKIVKITTTMPPAFSDPLIEQALPAINVPGESPLMAMLRAKNRPPPSEDDEPKR